jgi:hypothetical protein
MYQISININEDGKGSFALGNGCNILGEIKVQLIDGVLILLDTIVSSKPNLHAVVQLIIRETVEYARMHGLKIVTIAKIAQKQFSSNPALYADVWEKGL